MRARARPGPLLLHDEGHRRGQEAVRKALGVDRIGVVGGSYGTKIGQAYARHYGNHIEFLVLDSVIPTDGWDPWLRSTYHGIPRFLRDLCSGRQCRGITSDPVADLTALLARMGNSYDVPFVNPGGSRGHALIDPAVLFRIYDSDPPMFEAATRARFPSAIVSALHGDRYPLGRLYRAYRYAVEISTASAQATYNRVVFHATKCEDMPLPWRGETTRAGKLAKASAVLTTMPDSLFAPFPRATALVTPEIATCLDWIIADRQPVIQRLVEYTGRALVIAGEHDLRTPLENAEAALAELPGAVLLKVHASGHVPLGGSRCAQTAFADFVAGRPVQQCAPAVSPTPPEPIAPTSLARLKPWPGVAGTAGRTIAAVVATLRDVGYTAYTDGPRVGLRAGTLSVAADHSTATFRGVVYVAGIVLSGTLKVMAGSARVTVRGSGARGNLTISKSSISGRLGGKAVRARGASLVVRGPDNR